MAYSMKGCSINVSYYWMAFIHLTLHHTFTCFTMPTFGGVALMHCSQMLSRCTPPFPFLNIVCWLEWPFLICSIKYVNFSALTYDHQNQTSWSGSVLQKWILSFTVCIKYIWHRSVVGRVIVIWWHRITVKEFAQSLTIWY